MELALTAEWSLTFEGVYAQHYRFVWRVLRAYGVPPAAVEDVAQDVFVVVHRRLPDFEGRSSVRTWLFRIARWVVTHERRRFRARPTHEPIDDAIHDEAPGPFEMTARSQALRTLEGILSRMDEEKRIVFVLMDIEEMTANEVADLFQINVNTVYSRLRLAREQFRRLLGERDTPPEKNEP
ncbi:MAG: polymerase sigma factor RpoE [Labilithrix sp.]|nr:polymerase sigma factor RpoE [Labilithrix sp.]